VPIWGEATAPNFPQGCASGNLQLLGLQRKSCDIPLRRKVILKRFAILCLWAAPAFAGTPVKLSHPDEVAAFKAAGFHMAGGQWRACGDPGTDSYQAGAIDSVQDLNGDGRAEVVITEGSTFCYGAVETGFVLLSKQTGGTWKLVMSNSGVPAFLATKGVGNWPDIEIGGPGFCFPVYRWNGRKYSLARHQYDGKPCRPN
jgi:hypothetical protein